MEPVFPVSLVNAIASDAANRKTLLDLADIEQALQERFSEMREPIRALVLSVATGEPLLFVGPPGTAKSRLIRVFCEYIDVIKPTTENDGSNGKSATHKNGAKQDEALYFEYLLTPFTEPNELFGYFEVTEQEKKQTLRRIEDNMMQQATVVYLDEVFNGSSAILNSILAFMNERVFHDRGTRKKVKMQCMFGATNDIPTTPELRAVYDRFLLRCEVNNIAADVDKMARLFEVGWEETFGRAEPGTEAEADTRPAEPPMRRPDLLAGLKKLRNDIRTATRGDLPDHAGNRLLPNRDSSFYRKLVERVHTCRLFDYSEMSNRRLIKLLHVMLLNAMYRSVVKERATGERDAINRIELGEPEQDLLRFALDRWDDDVPHLLKFGDYDE